MKTKNRIDNALNQSFGNMQLDLETFVDHLFGKKHSQCGSSRGDCCWTPRTDIVETESNYLIEMELPGFAADRVNVEIKEGILEVSGEREKQDLEEGEKLVRRERALGKFARRFEFSTQVDAEKIGAEFKLGLLRLVVPKSEKELPRKIEIKVGD